MYDAGHIIGWSVGSAIFTMLLSIGITFALIYLLVKPDYVKRDDDLDAKIKSTIYDVNVQNAANKELDDGTVFYMKNVLLARIQNIEAKLSITPTVS